MTKEQLKQEFNNAAKQAVFNLDNRSPEKWFKIVYTLMFNEFPNSIGIINDGKYLNPKADTSNDISMPVSYDEFEAEDLSDDDFSEDITTFENVSVEQSFIKLHEKFKDNCYIFRFDTFPIIIGYKLIIFYDWYEEELFVLQDSVELREDIKECIVDNKFDKNIRIVSYITHDSTGFNKTKIQVSRQETNLNELYNDDLPDKEIFDFLNGDQSGLILLHGEAGTGKTNYIRNMMYRLKNHKFMILDNSVFAYITDASFIKLLMNNKNSVIILEDCEEMLADRVSGNSRISALLNLSDGILGDSFKFKFVCTFNTSVSQIDQALLRKGRMKMKYEFKKLCAEKTYALGQKIGKNIPMGESHTLADIFNYGIDNGNKNTKTVIGFGQK